MAEFEIKYKEADYRRITDAFYQIYCDNQEGDYETFLKALQTLVEYPTKVIETYLKSVLALDMKHFTKDYIMASKLYILMRMNLCTIKDE